MGLNDLDFPRATACYRLYVEDRSGLVTLVLFYLEQSELQGILHLLSLCCPRKGVPLQAEHLGPVVMLTGQVDRLAGLHCSGAAEPDYFPSVFTDQGPHVLSAIDSEVFLGVKTFYGQRVILAFPLPFQAWVH